MQRPAWLTRIRNRRLRRRVFAHVAERERALAETTQLRHLPIADMTEAAHGDPHFLLRQSRLGPYARFWHRDVLVTHIFDLATGRRFLSSHESQLGAHAFDLRGLVPHGALRQMEGETHRTYRSLFVEAFRAVAIARVAADLHPIFARAVSALLAREEAGIGEITDALRELGREVFLRLCFGLDRTDPEFDEVIGIYRDVNTAHLMTTLTRRRFERICALVSARPRNDRLSLQSHLSREGQLDATSLGNLALFAEMSAYDLVGLWSWVFSIVANTPQTLDELRALSGTDREALSEAAVWEALRLERSEYLVRGLRSEIVFDGVLFPAGSHISLAVWEAHKDPAKFPDPFRFDPHRFVGGRPSVSDYAPLGLDRHRCLGEAWIVGLTSMLLRTLAASADLQLLDDGPAQRDAFHFAPNEKLRIRFLPVRPAHT